MTPAEAMKHLRVLTEGVTEDAKKELLWQTVREVQNLLANVQDKPIPTIRGISSGSSNPLTRGRR